MQSLCWPAPLPQNYSADYLWQCTLVTTVEPVPCAQAPVLGAHRPAGLRHDQSRLLALTGNHAENPMALPCREVFARGQKAIEVIGPVPDAEPDIALTAPGFLVKTGCSPHSLREALSNR